MAVRRSKLREDLRAPDDPTKPWPVDDLIDALELIAVIRKRLLAYFRQTRTSEISLRQLMAMCLDLPASGRPATAWFELRLQAASGGQTQKTFTRLRVWLDWDSDQADIHSNFTNAVSRAHPAIEDCLALY